MKQVFIAKQSKTFTGQCTRCEGTPFVSVVRCSFGWSNPDKETYAILCDECFNQIAERVEEVLIAELDKKPDAIF